MVTTTKSSLQTRCKFAGDSAARERCAYYIMEEPPAAKAESSSSSESDKGSWLDESDEDAPPKQKPNLPPPHILRLRAQREERRKANPHLEDSDDDD